MKISHKIMFLLAPAISITLACNLTTSSTAPDDTVVTASEEDIPATSATTDVYIPTVTSNSSNQSTTGELITPEDFTYLGAFRLPDDGDRPRTFEYGGNAMTFRPGDDLESDGFPGTLFITGHDRLAYGEMTNGSQVAEISIPAPVNSRDVAQLNAAAFVQGFSDVAAGHFVNLDEIPRIGLAYLNHPATGPKLHLAWGQHMPFDPAPATHAWVDVDLTMPNFQGEWFIGEQDPNRTNGYLFEIPASWASTYTQDRPLATGRYRDGGWSGMGPTLFAYQPWTDESGTPAAPSAHLPETLLLQYASSYDTPNIERCLNGYQHPDEWEGGAWLTTASGKSAVIFAGTKSTSEKYWYGYVNPSGPEEPCVDEDIIGESPVCYLADGSPCPDEDLNECSGHNDMRGWWSSRFEAQIIFYAPEELARVAAGEIEAWQPQPYAMLSLESVLFHNPDNVEPDMLGTGTQRRFRIGEVAFDRTNGLLYVLELYADGAKPVVHVWQVHE